ncbi:hypothetical protein EVJ58_g9694 [Rhodofomes roseus]|uniref:Uncharacterized protein n=1 Tax=Rhodofomes roseus TaxID=34475 RepID=A0A4Y9XRQ9_9APHY|nr:hypothetical protein EVJ58_g9694 [Rhodofomes roseus]
MSAGEQLTTVYARLDAIIRAQNAKKKNPSMPKYKRANLDRPRDGPPPTAVYSICISRRWMLNNSELAGEVELMTPNPNGWEDNPTDLSSPDEDEDEDGVGGLGERANLPAGPVVEASAPNQESGAEGEMPCVPSKEPGASPGPPGTASAESPGTVAG